MNFCVDSVASVISAYGPEGSNAAINGSVSVTFSEAMGRSTAVFTVGGVAGTLSWTGDQVIFTPTEALVHLGVYIVSVSSTDLAGNSGNCTWTFTTDAPDHRRQGREDRDGREEMSGRPSRPP